jgi:hypothetical protein
MFFIFFLILLLQRYKIALTTFWKKFWWITLIFFIWFDSNFDFKKIWERNCLRKFCFSLDPDLDPYKINRDPQPWGELLKQKVGSHGVIYKAGSNFGDFLGEYKAICKTASAHESGLPVPKKNTNFLCDL